MTSGYTLHLTDEEVEVLVDAILKDSAGDIGAAVNWASGDAMESLGRKILAAAREVGIDLDALVRGFGVVCVDDDEEDEHPNLSWPDY